MLVDRSNSYQTADDQSNPSHSLSPTEQQSLSNRGTEKLEPSFTSIPVPTKSPTSSLKGRLKQTRHELEDSSDFMDSEALDRIIAQTRLEQEFEALQVQSQQRREAASVGGGDQENERICVKSSPLPAPPLPRRYSGSPSDPLLHQLPADSSQSAANTGDHFKLPTTDSLKQADLVGESGEFTVTTTTISPPIPPRKSSRDYGVEHTSVVTNPPPSPPPRIHSQGRKLGSLKCAPTEASSKNSEAVQGKDVPPSPPPRQRRELVTADKDGSLTGDVNTRSDSSSPEYQHRDLTQRERQGASSTEREGDEEVDLGEVQGNKEIWGSAVEMERQVLGEPVGGSDGGKSEEGEKRNQTEEETTGSIRKRRSSTCVDPVEEEDRVLEDSADEATSVTSTMKTLTSDEGESDEDTDVTVKTATLRYRANTHGEMDLQAAGASLHIEDSTESLLDRLPRPHFSDTPSVASLSLTQLNTPETTLHYSITNKLQSSGGIMTDSESVLLDSAMQLPGSEDLAKLHLATKVGGGVAEVVRPRSQSWVHHTLGNQLQVCSMCMYVCVCVRACVRACMRVSVCDMRVCTQPYHQLK